MMTVYDVAPDPTWTLDQWRTAAGTPSANELIEIGLSLHEVELVRAVIGRWRTGTVHSWINHHIAQIGDARALPALNTALKDEDPRIRRYAARAIARIKQ